MLCFAYDAISRDNHLQCTKEGWKNISLNHHLIYRKTSLFFLRSFMMHEYSMSRVKDLRFRSSPKPSAQDNSRRSPARCPRVAWLNGKREHFWVSPEAFTPKWRQGPPSSTFQFVWEHRRAKKSRKQDHRGHSLQTSDESSRKRAGNFPHWFSTKLPWHSFPITSGRKKQLIWGYETSVSTASSRHRGGNEHLCQ